MYRYGIVALADWEDPSLGAVSDGLDAIIANTQDASEDLVILEVVRVVRAPSAVATIELPDWCQKGTPSKKFSRLDTVVYYNALKRSWFNGVVDKVLPSGAAWVRDSDSDGVFFCEPDQIDSRPSEPAPAAEPAAFRVGDKIEADYTPQKSNPDWRMATLTKIDEGDTCPYRVVFDCEPDNFEWRKVGSVRRPSAPKFKFQMSEGVEIHLSQPDCWVHGEIIAQDNDLRYLVECPGGRYWKNENEVRPEYKFGQRVKVGVTAEKETDVSKCDAFFLGYAGRHLKVAVLFPAGGFDTCYFYPDQVFPL